jgi:hypothetical protein
MPNSVKTADPSVALRSGRDDKGGAITFPGGWRLGWTELGMATARRLQTLHCAPPDFLWRPVALMICMQLSLRRAAHVVVASSAK